MGAGRPVRAEPGTPATPTHLPGNTHMHTELCVFLCVTLKCYLCCFFAHIFLNVVTSLQKWRRVRLWLRRRAVPVPSGLRGNPQSPDPGLPRSPLSTGQPSVQPSNTWHACYVSINTHIWKHDRTTVTEKLLFWKFYWATDWTLWSHWSSFMSFGLFLEWNEKISTV